MSRASAAVVEGAKKSRVVKRIQENEFAEGFNDAAVITTSWY
jgi:hypothetical protein